MRAAILAIGDELALGDRIDTNSAHIASRLVQAGVTVIEHRTVPDEGGRIARALTDLSLADILVVTGGLGPTPDDCTRAALAVAGVKDRQSIPNGAGTAKGESGSLGDCRVYCLPGPPSEMEPMLEVVLGSIAALPEAACAVRVIHTCGISESEAVARLGERMDRSRRPQWGTTAHPASVDLWVRGFGASASALDGEVEDACRLLGQYAYGRDGESIAAATGRQLALRGESVALAESCTGGMLGEALTAVPGASAWFRGGVVAYANDAKRSLLGVSANLLEAHGAVSGEVACAMAAGAARALGARFGVATTGIAGPDGGSDAKPVGTVWIAVCDGGQTMVRRFRFRPPREAVRVRTTRIALQMLRWRVMGLDFAPLLGEWPA